MSSLFGGFSNYCRIPRERVTFLKWNGEAGDGSRFSPPEDGRSYALPGAIVLGDDGFWRLGLRIYLEFGTIAFAFWIAEQNGSPVTKIGEKVWRLDFSNEQLCKDFYDEVVVRVKEPFVDRKKPKGKTIGFIVDSE
jgi:hypothetical protein